MPRFFWLSVAFFWVSLTGPAAAQWSGLDYGETSADFAEDLELREQFEAFDTEPVASPSLPSPTPVSPVPELTTQRSPDEQLQTRPHLLPSNTPGIIPTAVHDPNGDLDGTVCANKFYKGRAMVVDLSQQRAHVYEPVLTNNVFDCKVVASFRVTTAKNGRVTPLGDFHLAPLERTTVAGYTIDWMTFTYKGKEFWGIHPANWQKGNFGEEWYRRKNGSLGCVRFDPNTWLEVKKYTFKHMLLRIRQ